MVIACDVDGVVADLNAAWLGRYNRDYDDDLTAARILAWDISRFVKPECGKKIYDYLDDPSLYDQVWPIAGALEGVRELRRRHRVVFVTATPVGQAGRKLRWLQHWGFLGPGKQNVDYVECLDKSLIATEFLIDDKPENVLCFYGWGILFDQPHNREARVPYRVTDWRDLTRFLERP